MNTGLNRWVVCLLLALSVPSAWGDTVFSFNGTGDPIRRVDARSRGMGSAGRALSDGNNFSSVNPALLASFKRAGLGSLYFIQHRSISDGSRSWGTSDGDLAGFHLVIPVRPGTVFSVGLEGLTDVDFGLLDSVGVSTSGAYVQQVKGSGGIQAATVAAGHRIGRFQVGARMDMILLGTVNERWTKVFVDPTFTSSEDDISRTHRGLQPSFGLIYQHDKSMSAALTASPAATITQTQRIRRYLGRLPFQRLLGWQEESELDVELPASLGLGFAYTTGYRWTVAADAARSYWSSTGAGGRSDTRELSLGVMYRTGSADLLQRDMRVELMGGLRSRTLYFSTPGGEQLGEWALSMGLGIPLRSNGVGTFRTIMEVGSRGDTSIQGLSERFVQVSFGFTGWVK